MLGFRVSGSIFLKEIHDSKKDWKGNLGASRYVVRPLFWGFGLSAPSARGLGHRVTILVAQQPKRLKIESSAYANLQH